MSRRWGNLASEYSRSIDTVRNTIAQHYLCTTGNYLRRIVDGLHARGDECLVVTGLKYYIIEMKIIIIIYTLVVLY